MAQSAACLWGNSMYDLKLEQADIVTVLKALSAQPLGAVLSTFRSIESQVAKQDSDRALEIKEPKEQADAD